MAERALMGRKHSIYRAEVAKTTDTIPQGTQIEARRSGFFTVYVRVGPYPRGKGDWASEGRHIKGFSRKKALLRYADQENMRVRDVHKVLIASIDAKSGLWSRKKSTGATAETRAGLAPSHEVTLIHGEIVEPITIAEGFHTATRDLITAIEEGTKVTNGRVVFEKIHQTQNQK